MFSASVPPPILGAVLGGLEVLDREPQLMDRLHANVQYALTEFEAIGIRTSTQSAIIPIQVPQHVHIRKAAYALHEMGIFVNSIEYPAVPVREQRFRVSLMATHTKEDIDRLISAFSIIWEQYVVRPRGRQAKDCSSSQASIYA
jgi:glycine C-acetyltransferase